MKEKKTINPWDAVLAFSTEEEAIKHDAQLLMFGFLSEVSKYQELQQMTRKTLSQKIRTSASYLTQLFRGNKPLNFETLAKLQKALNIKFQITARPSSEDMVINEKILLAMLENNTKSGGMWYWKSFNKAIKDDIYCAGTDAELLNFTTNNYENKAVPA